MTYNVHSCIGTDGNHSVDRIADVIRGCSADVVCLQELDVRRKRTRSVDQAERLAEILQMDCHFHPALNIADEQYGDAILSRYPLKLIRAATLPSLYSPTTHEPRGAIWVAAELAGVEVQMVNTHLSLARRDRRAQVEALLGPDWLGHDRCRGPALLCGDLNALPCSAAFRRTLGRFRDAQRSLSGHRPRPTFPSRFPLLRIDHVLINEWLAVEAVSVPRSPLVRTASDHLPLVVDLRVRRDCLREAPA